MSKSAIDNLKSGVLSEPMVRKGVEYEDFRLLIRSKALNLSKSDQIKIFRLVLALI